MRVHLQQFVLAILSAFLLIHMAAARSPVEDTGAIQDAGLVRNVAWSPDGMYLAVASSDGIHLYTANRDFIASIGSGLIDDVAWSPDSEQLASVSLDEEMGATVIVWDIQTLEPETTIVDPDAFENKIDIEWNDASDLLAITGIGVRVWDLNTETQIYNYQFPTRASTIFVEFSPDGDLIAWDMGVQAMAANSMQYVFDHASVINASWSPDGQYLAVSSFSASGQQIEILDVAAKSVERTIPTEQVVSNLMWQGNTLAAVESGFPRLLVWDARSFELLDTRDIRDTYLALDADGTQIAFAGEDGTLQISPVPGHNTGNN
jgi:WD40 repeat protein